ncbi:MAG: hypothetical protein LBD55_04085 [Treponema sp.]|jgi:hypothetical protein|nr:hypothetical protein [Treponema sp.]
MNTNLLAVLKEISGKYGEGVLGDPERLRWSFDGLAKNEPKPLRNAFCLCIEEGAYSALKSAADLGSGPPAKP